MHTIVLVVGVVRDEMVSTEDGKEAENPGPRERSTNSLETAWN